MHKNLLLGLSLIVCWLVSGLSYAGDASATPSAAPPPPAVTAIGLDGLQPPPPPKKKPEPPKKTEYDKLPYAELLQKAEANDLVAQFELGSRYNYGRTLPKDTPKALQWLRKAANAGHKEALRLLALKYYDGYDVAPNYKEAMKWTEKLAELHDVAAQMTLGNMYANGDTKGEKRNLPRAYAWYSIATSAEPGDNDELIQAATEERNKIAGLISAKEEADAQKFASKWWAKHPPPVKPKEMSKEEMAKMAKEPVKAVTQVK